MVVAPALIATDGATNWFTVILMKFDVSFGGIAHPRLDVSTTVNESWSVTDDATKMLESVPTSTPFCFHWYEGALPPFTGVAVNLTDPPGQMDVVFARIETSGASDVPTFIFA
jgi:hypothetical protein